MLRSYLTLALRTLRSQRSYTFLNLTGLSVGMAGGLLIFVFLRHHLSTDRHHAHFDRLVRISTDLHLDDGSIEFSAAGPGPLAKALRTRYPQVEQAGFLLGIRELNVAVRQSTTRPPTRFLEHEGVGFVEPEWLETLTYEWLQGDAKTALRAPNRAVLTESWAQRYFGTADALGQTLILDNKATVTVTGIVADPPGPTDTPLGLFVSLSTAPQIGVTMDPNTDWWALNSANRVYARLKSPEALTRLQTAMPDLSKQQYEKSAHIFQFMVQPLSDLHFDIARDPAHAIRSSLLWALGVVGLLLVLAACINFVNLATAQRLQRGKEVGVRKTLGSSRGQLVGQFLLETLLLVLAATVMAVLLTRLLLPFFNNWVQLNLTLRLNAPTVGFIGALLLGVVLLAGAYPALVLSGVSPWAALRGRLTTSASGLRVRQGLVVVQFAVCQALIFGALVVVQQVRYIQEADLGFQKDKVVVVNLPYGQKPRQDAFKQKLLEHTAIQSVSLSVLPPSNSLFYGGSFKFDGKPDWEKYPITDKLGDADYLKTYGLHLLAGRNITPGDTIRDYVINETLMRKLGFQRPEAVLGRRLQYHLSAVPLPIVGVVKDFHQKSLREIITPCILANQASWYRRAGIRLTGNPGQALTHIQQTWRQIFPDEVFTYQFLDQQIAQLYQTETLINRVINTFTILAILICCLGLYGLVTHVVTQRTKEIGIRKVLGASVAGIVRLLSGDFLKPVLLAALLGLPLAGYVMSRWLQDFAFRIELTWWLFALAGGLAVCVALLTVSFQSIKAALANPVKSLRNE